jgi:NADPH-dependent 2,4-dienoyl-CoA reductase/sulfur reductase-like enzyme/predicted acylesterase/phospholipase RssA
MNSLGSALIDALHMLVKGIFWMPRDIDYLLLGGGLASATAAATLRTEGTPGSIVLLSNEEVPPYYRSPLSKQFLLGSRDVESLYIRPERFYRERDIELLLNTPVAALNTEAQSVTTGAGEQIRYGQLLIATGVRPKPLPIPGVILDGVHYLNRKTECEAIRQAVSSGAKNAVVVGADFRGMEIAMSLIALGAHVTIIEADAKVLKELASPVVSDYFKQYVESCGALVLVADTPLAFHGNMQLQEVETVSGRRIQCDLAVVSIGAMPNTEFLDGSGILMEDDGLVVVDDQLRTNAPNVYAAGDVTSFYDPVFARRRHIEHADNSLKQGRLAAKNMAGRRLRYDDVSYFYCEVGDIGFSVIGDPEEDSEQIWRGPLEDKSAALFYLKENIPRALLSIGRPVEETRTVEGLIRYRVNLQSVKSQLSDPAFSLHHIPTQTVLILQGGGALGAFECGVIKAMEEEQLFPDIVAGVSIGALNGAIVAANPRHATAALESFWADLTVERPFRFPGKAGRAITSMEILMYGVPNFFTPRWLQPFANPSALPVHWNSYYDTAPMKKLIAKYVDFPSLKTSPVRLLVGAVNVSTGRLEVFDSYVDELTPDHVLASGSLPPGFPWTVIDGKAYWDGGIVSNSPLELLEDRFGPEGKRVYVIDLFAGQRDLPTTIMEVMARRDEIFYSEKIRSHNRLRETVDNYRTLVNFILKSVEPGRAAKIKQHPLYIELIGEGAIMNITRFVREGTKGEPSSRDYDFSAEAIRGNQLDGYELVKKTLSEVNITKLNSDAPAGKPPMSVPIHM